MPPDRGALEPHAVLLPENMLDSSFIVVHLNSGNIDTCIDP